MIYGNTVEGGLILIAYKGFKPGLVCRGYQFHMGLNMTDKANCRANGFHCAEDPLDCLSYYPDMNQTEYYIVEAGGDIFRHSRSAGNPGSARLFGLQLQ